MKKPSYKSQEWLEKFGWKEGEGLGKSRDGITDFIRVKKKKDNAGLGVTKPPDGFDLWDHLYNRSAAKIQVHDHGGSVKLKHTEKDDRLPPKEPDGTDFLKNNYSGRFVKSDSSVYVVLASTFHAHSWNRQMVKEKSYASRIPEVALFEICGKRTLRKYSQTGKLKRLREQERTAQSSLILNPAKRQRIQEEQIPSETLLLLQVKQKKPEMIQQKKKKKKKKKKKRKRRKKKV